MTTEDAILENARRLENDARLLFGAERYASCGLLQLFCLEELGKAYLSRAGIKRDKTAYHRQKQTAAISLAGAVKVRQLLEEKCKEEGWDYWEELDDADMFFDWLVSAQGQEQLRSALGELTRWIKQSANGFLEKLRRISAYIDLDSTAPGASIEPGRNFTYKSFDRWFAHTAFEFVEAGFQCLEDEKTMTLVEGIRCLGV